MTDTRVELDRDALTREHYEHYPYPAGAFVEWSPDWPDRTAFLTGRSRVRSARQHRILIAGCGTREAVQWALAFPGSEVVGIDVSTVSLALTQRLAAVLGLADRVRVHALDILTLDTDTALPFAPGFDIIVAFGVVHHLSRPADGLANLGRLLAPDGVVYLMVYSATHRAPIRAVDTLAHHLAPEGTSTERVARLVALAEQAADYPGPLADTLRMVLEQAASDTPALMDTFGHPQYAMYTVDGLFDLIEAAGLRFFDWAQPGDWRPAAYLQGEVRGHLERLPPRERYDLIDRVFAPLMVAYAQHPAHVSPPVLPFDAPDATWLAHAFRLGERRRLVLDGEGRPGAIEIVRPDIQVAEGEATVTFRPGLEYRDHAVLAPLLARLDGRATLGEVADGVAAQARIPNARLRALAVEAARTLVSPHEALVPIPHA